MRKYIVFVFLLIFFLAGCQRNSDIDDSDNTKRIVVTSYVLSDFAKQMVDDTKTTVLLEPGENPKEHELSKRDINFINHSDVFIYNGDEIDTWVNDFIKSSDFTNDDLIIINAAEGIEIKKHTILDKTMDTSYMLTKELDEAEASNSKNEIKEENEDIYETDENGDIILDENFEPILKQDNNIESDTIEQKSEDVSNNIDTEINYCNIWMSPDNAIKMVKNIYNGLCDLEYIDIDDMDKKYSDYVELLKSLGQRFINLGEKCDYKFAILTGEFNCYYLFDFMNFDYMSSNINEYKEGTEQKERKDNIEKFLKNNKRNGILSENCTIKSKLVTSLKNFEINSITNIQRKDYGMRDYSYYEIMQENYNSLKNVL